MSDHHTLADAHASSLPSNTQKHETRVTSFDRRLLYSNLSSSQYCQLLQHLCHNGVQVRCENQRLKRLQVLQNQIVILRHKREKKGGHELAFVTFPQRSEFQGRTCVHCRHMISLENGITRLSLDQNKIPGRKTHLIQKLLQSVQHPSQPLIFELDPFRLRHLNVRDDDGYRFRHQQLQVTFGFVVICFEQFFQSLDVFLRRNVLSIIAGYFA